MKSISAYWPFPEQPLSLGNLLTFRQELELVARQKDATKITIYFSKPIEQLVEKIPYFQDALQSSIDIEVAYSADLPQPIDWPPQKSEISKWDYGTLRRVFLLKQILHFPVILSWPLAIEEAARSHYTDFQDKKDQQIIAVHLKRQSGGPEESNATLEAWEHLFRSHKETKFILLGKDPLSPQILALPNVLSAQQHAISLPVQLAFCAVADGFMGMASGICSAALFSATPYIIFKHPAHHAAEMQIEMGAEKSFPFSQMSQQLWRTTDTTENLTAALKMISNFKKGAH